MIRRVFKWVCGLTLLLLVIVFIGLPLLANTEQGRRRLARALSEATGREVSIGDLEVGLFFKSMDVADLEMANPEGFPEGALLEAASVHFDVNFSKILEGQIKGSLTGARLKAHIIRKGDGTNLDGFAPEPGGDGGEGGPDLDLALHLLDCQLTIEDLDRGEKVVVDGVSLAMRLANRGKSKTAGLEIRIRSIDDETLRLRNIEVDARRADDHLDLERITADLAGQGRVAGSGRLQVRGGDAWTLKLDLERVGVDKAIMPFVGALYPLASATGGQVDGTFDGGFELSGNGLTWDAAKPTLKGSGRVTLTGMRAPEGSLLSLITQLAGGPAGALTINDAGAEFSIADGWISFHRLSASGKEARYDLAGRVSLDGELKLSMDLLPLVKRFNSGAYAKASRYVSAIPLRIEGTTLRPRLKAPKADDLLKGIAEGALEKGISDILDRIRKKKR